MAEVEIEFRLAAQGRAAVFAVVEVERTRMFAEMGTKQVSQSHSSGGEAVAIALEDEALRAFELITRKRRRSIGRKGPIIKRPERERQRVSGRRKEKQRHHGATIAGQSGCVESCDQRYRQALWYRFRRRIAPDMASLYRSQGVGQSASTSELNGTRERAMLVRK